MGSKHFQNKAHRSFWSVHVEAWRQSGLTCIEYCREQRLTKSTFDRWLKALDAWESLIIKERERRRRAKHPLSANKRAGARPRPRKNEDWASVGLRSRSARLGRICTTGGDLRVRARSQSRTAGGSP